MPALTRGPLPPSVYWRRRLILLSAALVILWALIHVLGGGDSTPKADSAADLTAAKQTAGSAPTAAPSVGTSTGPSAAATTSPTTSPTTGATAPPFITTPTSTLPATPTVQPTPSGPCPPSDMSVSPSITGAAAGSDVAIVLNLQTFSTPACTWQISHKTMQVKVTTAGGSDVWSTIQCPAALVPSTVTVYKDTVTPVTVTWSAKKSDASCSSHTAWSQKGKYSVTAVALGGVPDQESFTLGAPVATPPAQSSTSPTAGTSQPAAPSSTPTTKPATSATATATNNPNKANKPKKHKTQHAD